MKRSDMLSKIASVIINYNETHCIINRDKAMEMAETILKVQEELGMVPPLVHPIHHYALDQIEYLDSKFKKWESEGEE